MPSWKTTDYRDTKRWIECMAQAAKNMIADGWSKHARKFHEVRVRRATAIYRGFHK